MVQRILRQQVSDEFINNIFKVWKIEGNEISFEEMRENVGKDANEAIL